MVNVVDELLTQEKLDSTVVKISTPTTIREMIEQQLERLNPEEQRVLEVASVAGVEFSVAAVAAGNGKTADEVEQWCAALARRGQFLQAKDMADWPDGTIATRYGFLHALYQEVAYERVPVGRQAYLHQRIGEREESAYGKQANEIAAALAVHFERGRDYRKAVQYRQQAGENAIRCSATVEAVSHFTRGLELLRTLPDTPDCALQELMLQIALGPALIAVKGNTAPEVEQTYTRALELCQLLGGTPQRFPALRGLQFFYLVRAEYQRARELAVQLLALAQRVQDSAFLMEAHVALGITSFWLGDFSPVGVHLERGRVLELLVREV
jgi:predicted ATPase